MKRALFPLLLFLALPALAQVSFKNAELRTSLEGFQQGDEGKLVVDRRAIRFLALGDRTLSLPTGAVKKVVYSRVSGRRWKSALIPAYFFPPTLFLMLSKGRKHYVELAFDDGRDFAGAVEFKLHKSNYRGALRAIEQVTGLTALYEQEGIEDSKQILATNSHPVSKP